MLMKSNQQSAQQGPYQGKNKSRRNRSGKNNQSRVFDQKPVTNRMLQVTPVPNAIEVNLSWSCITSLSTISDDFNFVRVKLNSVNDCGLSLTSNNAQGWLNYFGTYSCFLVTASSIKVDVVNTDNDVPMRISVTPTLDDPTRTPTWTSDLPLLSSNNSTYKLVGNANGMDRITITRTCDVGKFAGVGHLTPQAYEYTGTTAQNLIGVTDPVTLGSWIIAAQALSSATDNLDCVVSIEVVYRVRLYDQVVPIYNALSEKPSPLSRMNAAKRHSYYADMWRQSKLSKDVKELDSKVK